MYYISKMIYRIQFYRNIYRDNLYACRSKKNIYNILETSLLLLDTLYEDIPFSCFKDVLFTHLKKTCTFYIKSCHNNARFANTFYYALFNDIYTYSNNYWVSIENYTLFNKIIILFQILSQICIDIHSIISECELVQGFRRCILLFQTIISNICSKPYNYIYILWQILVFVYNFDKILLYSNFISYLYNQTGGSYHRELQQYQSQQQIQQIQQCLENNMSQPNQLLAMYAQMMKNFTEPFVNALFSPMAGSSGVPWGYPWTTISWRQGNPLPNIPVQPNYYDKMVQNYPMIKQFQDTFQNISVQNQNQGSSINQPDMMPHNTDKPDMSAMNNFMAKRKEAAERKEAKKLAKQEEKAAKKAEKEEKKQARKAEKAQKKEEKKARKEAMKEKERKEKEELGIVDEKKSFMSRFRRGKEDGKSD